MKVTIGSQNAGIIIVDIENGIEMHTRVPRMEFELTNATSRIIEIGTTTLTPTVNTDVAGFEFSESTKTLKVFDSKEDTVYSTSTDSTTILVRVDFNTNTITVFE
jgi:hypothetical protein